MSANAGASKYIQIQSIMQVVIPQVAKNESMQFDRSIIVTSEVSDFSVTEKTIRINPSWAVECGPLEAANRILSASKHFDYLKANAREWHRADLLRRMGELRREAVRCFGEYGYEVMLNEVENAERENAERTAGL